MLIANFITMGILMKLHHCQQSTKVAEYRLTGPSRFLDNADYV